MKLSVQLILLHYYTKTMQTAIFSLISGTLTRVLTTEKFKYRYCALKYCIINHYYGSISDNIVKFLSLAKITEIVSNLTII